MNDYGTKNIRNLCVLGHSGSGKTSLTEAMLYIGQGSDRLGKVADGNTVSDYDNEEMANIDIEKVKLLKEICDIFLTASTENK